MTLFDERTNRNTMEISRSPLLWASVDTILLAQVGSDPYWPGQIRRSEEQDSSGYGAFYKQEGNEFFYFVIFFNDYTAGWVSENNLKQLTARAIENYCHPMSVELDGAIEEALNRLREKKNEPWKDENWEMVKGDVVLATFEIFPPWPAVIHDFATTPNGGQMVCVHYLGENTYSFVEYSDVWKFTMERVQSTKVIRNNIHFGPYTVAVQEACQKLGIE